MICNDGPSSREHHHRHHAMTGDFHYEPADVFKNYSRVSSLVDADGEGPHVGEMFSFSAPSSSSSSSEFLIQSLLMELKDLRFSNLFLTAHAEKLTVELDEARAQLAEGFDSIPNPEDPQHEDCGIYVVRDNSPYCSPFSKKSSSHSPVLPPDIEVRLLRNRMSEAQGRIDELVTTMGADYNDERVASTTAAERAAAASLGIEGEEFVGEGGEGDDIGESSDDDHTSEDQSTSRRGSGGSQNSMSSQTDSRLESQRTAMTYGSEVTSPLQSTEAEEGRQEHLLVAELQEARALIASYRESLNRLQEEVRFLKEGLPEAIVDVGVSPARVGTGAMVIDGVEQQKPSSSCSEDELVETRGMSMHHVDSSRSSSSSSDRSAMEGFDSEPLAKEAKQSLSTWPSSVIPTIKKQQSKKSLLMVGGIFILSLVFLISVFDTWNSLIETRKNCTSLFFPKWTKWRVADREKLAKRQDEAEETASEISSAQSERIRKQWKQDTSITSW